MTRSARNPASKTTHAGDPELVRLDRETWLAKRLGCYAEVFAGTTDPATRCERLRAHITAHESPLRILGKASNGKPLTLEQAFESTYHQPLETRHAAA